MSEFKKIMVALGVTQYSEGIFKYAAKLAVALDAELLVVNIINSRDVESIRSISAMGYEVDGAHYVEGVRADRAAFLQAIFDRTDFSPDRIRTVIKVGNPYEKLLEIIVRENVDMVVMGPKGRTDLEHMLVGSVASKIFRKSPVTVVSYRSEAEAEQLRRHIRVDS
jgi:nucleotide-binding universal stress UspA family protein